MPADHPQAKETIAPVHYCVTAVIDLLGFASHLEVGGADVRTTIGKEAITRLGILEQALQYMEAERAQRAEEYPRVGFFHIRINDSIVLVADLPSYLLPHTGDTVRSGMTSAQFHEHFNIDDYETEADFEKAAKHKYEEAISDMAKFVGLVARLHAYIDSIENTLNFPGAKTVIATGFRRPFVVDGKDDFLAANFSFSNAYIASEKHLRGGGLFADNNVVRLLSGNTFCRNILRYASFISRGRSFDVFDDQEDVFSGNWESFQAEPREVELFRKKYWFQQLTPRALTHLQRVEWLGPFLRGEKVAAGKSLFLRAFKGIQSGMSEAEIKTRKCKTSALYAGNDDIREDVRLLSELMVFEQSPILEARQKKERDKEMAATRRGQT